jgi:hypothetical protein
MSVPRSCCSRAPEYRITVPRTQPLSAKKPSIMVRTRSRINVREVTGILESDKPRARDCLGDAGR